MCLGKRPLAVAATLFVLAEVTLGVLVHTLRGAAVARVSYAAVVLAFAFCLLFMERSTDYLLTQAALLTTCAADWILVLHPDRSYLVAMCFFSAAQLLYGARMTWLTVGRLRSVGLWLRLALTLAAWLTAYLVAGSTVDALALVSLFYFANLIVNALLAFLTHTACGTLAAGFLLFLLCDIFVGFGMLGEYIPLPSSGPLAFMASPPINMAWVFYVPSQTLLALSLLPRRLGKE